MDLKIVASARLADDEPVRRLPGFIVSDFAPRVVEVVRRCLGGPPSELVDQRGDRTAIVLASERFDSVTLELAVEQAERGRINPVLFHQAVPTSVLGVVARDYGITGPVTCVAALGDPRGEAFAVARALVADRSADQVIAIVAESPGRHGAGFATADLVRG